MAKSGAEKKRVRRSAAVQNGTRDSNNGTPPRRQAPGKDVFQLFAEKVRDHKDLESRWAVLQETRVEYFRGKDFVSFLKNHPELKEVLESDKNLEVEDIANVLLRKNLLVRCDRVVKSVRPGKRKLSTWPAHLELFPGMRILTAFAGPKNMHIIPAANTYVQIRGLAWPALLVGWVAQSASLGMKDSWGPFKALAVASAVNGIGDIILCCFFGYGIAGAAWATMVSQVVAAFMMIRALNKKGFNAFSLSIPSPKELLQILELAAPVFLTMISKVAFYSLLTLFATSMGTITVAAHQVMIQVYCMCTVWGEPLSQTAQSFMPELVYGVNRSLEKAAPFCYLNVKQYGKY